MVGVGDDYCKYFFVYYSIKNCIFSTFFRTKKRKANGRKFALAISLQSDVAGVKRRRIFCIRAFTASLARLLPRRRPTDRQADYRRSERPKKRLFENVLYQKYNFTKEHGRMGRDFRWLIKQGRTTEETLASLSSQCTCGQFGNGEGGTVQHECHECHECHNDFECVPQHSDSNSILSIIIIKLL